MLQTNNCLTYQSTTLFIHLFMFKTLTNLSSQHLQWSLENLLFNNKFAKTCRIRKHVQRCSSKKKRLFTSPPTAAQCKQKLKVNNMANRSKPFIYFLLNSVRCPSNPFFLICMPVLYFASLFIPIRPLYSGIDSVHILYIYIFWFSIVWEKYEHCLVLSLFFFLCACTLLRKFRKLFYFFNAFNLNQIRKRCALNGTALCNSDFQPSFFSQSLTFHKFLLSSPFKWLSWTLFIIFIYITLVWKPSFFSPKLFFCYILSSFATCSVSFPFSCFARSTSAHNLCAYSIILHTS